MTSPSNQISEIEILVPHRISGFFQIMDQPEERSKKLYEKIGSRGGGPALTAFGKTKLELINNNYSMNENHIEIMINGENRTNNAVTTLSVIQEMQKFIKIPLNLKISHEFELPSGCGYGTSGAGALGVALGLNLLYDLGFSTMQAAKFAHIAEVINHTGLGTVGGQYVGGLSITMNPGWPFNMDNILIPSDISVVVGSFGAISTASILTHPVYREKIIHAGQEAMALIHQHYDISNYMKICRQFIEKTELLKLLQLDRIESLMKELNELSIYGASMNQLGKSVFTICKKSQINSVLEIYERYKPTHTLKSLEICHHGPYVKFIK